MPEVPASFINLKKTTFVYVNTCKAGTIPSVLLTCEKQAEVEHCFSVQQVLRRDYCCSADVWSAGVILYILLCGYPPFGGKSDSRILQKVQLGTYSFANREVGMQACSLWGAAVVHHHLMLPILHNTYQACCHRAGKGPKCMRACAGCCSSVNYSDCSKHLHKNLHLHVTELQWDNVTEAAKSFISEMLVMDMHQRTTAAALLQHRWFKSDGGAATAPAAALGAHMVRRLRAFANMNHMKRLALVVLARTLTDKDVNRLRVSGWWSSCTQYIGRDGMLQATVQ